METAKVKRGEMISLIGDYIDSVFYGNYTCLKDFELDVSGELSVHGSAQKYIEDLVSDGFLKPVNNMEYTISTD